MFVLVLRYRREKLGGFVNLGDLREFLLLLLLLHSQLLLLSLFEQPLLLEFAQLFTFILRLETRNMRL